MRCPYESPTKRNGPMNANVGVGQASTPGAFEWELTAAGHHITSECGASAPMARPQKTGLPLDGRAAHFEWIAPGCTEKCFWTVAWRQITWLENQVRFTG
jgi:hypothetical protein